MKKGNNKFLSFLFLTFVVGSTIFLKFSSPSVPKRISALPEDEKETLDGFFHYLFQDSFSYVLFGTKPMAVCTFLEIKPNNLPFNQIDDFIDFSFTKFYSSNLLGIKGWETWEKHAHLFPSSNYILLENHDGKKITIIMINKKSFLKSINENINEFQEVLGGNITAEMVLSNCLNSNNLFRDALKENDKLFGILLGYGKHNSQLFDRRNQIERHHSMCPSIGFSSLDEENHYLNTTLTFFDDFEVCDFNPLFISLPEFVADHDHPETKDLKNQYTKQYKETIKKYKNGNFLEVTLRQFCRQTAS